jgi:hypothetical protein
MNGGGGSDVERLLYSVTALGIILIFLVFFSLRRAHIRVEYSVSWLVAGFALLILSRSEGALEMASRFLGLTQAPFALLLIIGGVFLIVFYRFSIIISRLKDDNIALAQRVAILEYYVRSDLGRNAASGS